MKVNTEDREGLQVVPQRHLYFTVHGGTVPFPEPCWPGLAFGNPTVARLALGKRVAALALRALPRFMSMGRSVWKTQGHRSSFQMSNNSADVRECASG